jgi:hypothetical protein
VVVAAVPAAAAAQVVVALAAVAGAAVPVVAGAFAVAGAAVPVVAGAFAVEAVPRSAGVVSGSSPSAAVVPESAAGSGE